MGNQITVVSGFFYIGRDKSDNPDLVRSNEKYLEYFRGWARMRNKLVVYTEPVFVDEVYKIRESFGLREQTVVIPVEDVFSIEKELYERMEKVSQNPDFRNYRLLVNVPSNIANYDYVMMMKYWCLQDAVERGLVEDMAAWMDFGYNHGGACYTNPEEFDFLWEHDFSRKIHVFALYDPTNYLAVRSWQTQRDCVMGAPVVVAKELCKELWDMVKAAMNALLWLECIDDDQQLLLMSYKQKKELFEVHISDWFMPLKEYGGEHLSVKPKVKIKQSLKVRVKVFLAKLAWRTPERRFARRMLSAVEKRR